MLMKEHGQGLGEVCFKHLFGQEYFLGIVVPALLELAEQDLRCRDRVVGSLGFEELADLGGEFVQHISQ